MGGFEHAIIQEEMMTVVHDYDAIAVSGSLNRW